MRFLSESTLQIPAAIAALLNIYLGARVNIWNWFFGAIAVTIYAYIFYLAKLYGDMSLQAVYFIFQIYGFYEWKYGGKMHSALAVMRLPKILYSVSAIVFFVLFALFYYLLSHDTNSTTPMIDAFTTALSLVAQWMMCKKYLENWLLWIAMDIISVYMYWYKHLYLTSGLYAVFLVLCVIGYRTWKMAAT